MLSVCESVDAMPSPLEELITRLHELSAVKFGKFTLKSGIESPVYLDLRVIISYPKLLAIVAETMWCQGQGKIPCDVICGVPYAALPLATVISVNKNIPMLIIRKESKGHGTKKQIEGNLVQGQTCAVIEDVISSGSSILETALALRAEGLIVNDAIVLLDRGHGGTENLAAEGITLHSVCTLHQVLEILARKHLITNEIFDQSMTFLSSQQMISFVNERLQQTYGERKRVCHHPLSKRLLSVMEKKKTNLCLSADVFMCEELMPLVRDLGPLLCMVKVHADTLKDFSLESMNELAALAHEHDLLIFEDRKFSDIGSTVKEQYSGGLMNIRTWADVVTIHPIPGPAIIEALKTKAAEIGSDCRGAILVAQMSSAGNFISSSYTTRAMELVEEHSDYVMGYIGTSSLTGNPSLLQFTPGVSLGDSGDGLGQVYMSPREAVLEKGADVIIVGRGILKAPDRKAACQQYRDAGFQAYLERCSHG